MPSLSLTLDDAPSVQEPGVRFDASRMDRCREILTAWGVRHCVAFVVGERAVGQESSLERWLAAGYELGNHTHTHVPVSEQPERFSESLARCDEVLTRVGAFDSGRPKWFRFPHLDRGKDPDERQRMVTECRKLGYRIAPATIDFLDYPYEAPLEAALGRRLERDVARVEQRFFRVFQTRLEMCLAGFACCDPPLPHIGYAHFGPVAERKLWVMLGHLHARGVELCSLDAALEHPLYRRFATDLSCNGLMRPETPPDLRGRIGRRVADATEWLAWFDRRRYGPVYPR